MRVVQWSVIDIYSEKNQTYTANTTYYCLFFLVISINIQALIPMFCKFKYYVMPFPFKTVKYCIIATCNECTWFSNLMPDKKFLSRPKR